MEEKILLVDDEEGIRKVLGISLRDRGYEVFTAGNGEEALRVFRRENPAIVLTDIKMPGMDGIEVLRQIKAESPETEVIMITGHGDMDLAIQSIKNDAADFITKPINDDALDIALGRAKEKIFFKKQIREHTENLEKLVEEKTRALMEAERLAAVGQTVAGLAHAIKNITSGLTGGAFVLEKGLELDNRTYLLQGWRMIKENIDRIKDMALELLNYARERELERRPCDPNRILREIHELMLPRAEACGVTLELDTEEDLPRVLLDPEEIHRCLLNLVTNAIEACEGKGASPEPLRVVLRSRRNGAGGVSFEIIDNGCGMDEETREKVFRRFFSTKGSRGTGLGLMITKKIVDAHGGRIELQSEEKKGTRFIIRLPGEGGESGEEAGNP
ncbi:MAG: response regulator [Deltaproteobacteria bacterium]|nr:response regulator [Deltaproteobacteria bacterium]MBW2016301.1 response regulator [Deltaproteobacteria bacterium]MBW2129249.1 response regulator [Deltaproteobacteria bacterium]MBW2304358.1 response regulator [Deltaproteobacteria bacterium]